MFSQAGNPWSRGVVENIKDTSRTNLWRTKALSKIDKRILPLEEYGIHEIDYANYISKTKNWDTDKINGLRSTFQIDQYSDQMWMASRVVGSLNEHDSVQVRAIPKFLFSADTTHKNPIFFHKISH